jgi:glycosyltransferase involved in cell wall biosynthesis
MQGGLGGRHCRPSLCDPNGDICELRILFATDFLHVPQGGGGAERNTHALCLALRGMGDDVAVSCDLRVDGSWLSLFARIRRKLARRAAFVRDTVNSYACYRGWDHEAVLLGACRDFRPDVVVLQSTDPSRLIAALAPSGVPVVAYFHEVEEIGHLAFLRDTAIPIIANSEFTAGRLKSVCGLDSRVVPPLIDPAEYAVAKMRPSRVLFVNTMTRKGVEVAFGVAALRPDIPFEFVLSWTHGTDALASLRRRAKAAGNITLHPPTQSMRPIYARAKVLLVPSQWEEAWGRVATEAHVNGIPVIASDRGGLPEAVGPGGIVLPASASARDWASALSSLWDNAALYAELSAASRRYGQRPDIQPRVIAGGLRDILAGLLAAAGRSSEFRLDHQ